MTAFARFAGSLRLNPIRGPAARGSSRRPVKDEPAPPARTRSPYRAQCQCSWSEDAEAVAQRLSQARAAPDRLRPAHGFEVPSAAMFVLLGTALLQPSLQCLRVAFPARAGVPGAPVPRGVPLPAAAQGAAGRSQARLDFRSAAIRRLSSTAGDQSRVRSASHSSRLSILRRMSCHGSRCRRDSAGRTGASPPSAAVGLPAGGRRSRLSRRFVRQG